MRFLPHDAADELLVTPPCLAGGGDPRWVTVALHQAGDGATTTLRSPRSSIWSGPTSRPS
ncbi:hypothetical protein OG235_07770 [Streptomyces sp. NBC_00024]|uniref:hypothetical protein n=1 Tax=Streptomyces sp. NBC_00024 TaxID=2903612 RepID=UPI00324D1D8B